MGFSGIIISITNKYSADKSLQVKLPKNKVFETAIDTKTLEEEQSFVSDYFEITYNSGIEDLMLSVKCNTNAQFKNHIYELELMYYDKDNEYMYSEIIHRALKMRKFPKERKLSYDESVSRIVVKETFTSLRAAKYLAETSDLPVEYLTTEDITTEKMLLDGAVYLYVSSFDLGVDASNYKREELEYILSEGISRFSLEDGKEIMYIDNYSKKSIRILTTYLDKIKDIKSLRIETNEKGEILVYYDNGSGTRLQGHANVIRLFDKDKNVMKIYINTDSKYLLE